MFALTRCASCGSPNVMFDSKKEGYNIAKGLVGTALVGAPGALLGTDGKKTYYYHCPDCGMTLSYKMDEVTALKISAAISDYEKTGKVDFILQEYKKKYKNIEWGEKIPEKIDSGRENFSDEEKTNIIKDELLVYLNSVGTVVLYDQLKDKYKDDYFCFSSAINALENRGQIAYESIDDQLYCRLVTDVNEVKELILKKAARKEASKMIRQQYDQLEDGVFEKANLDYLYTKNEIEGVVTSAISGIVNADNPYLEGAVLNELLYRLKSYRVIDCIDNDSYKFNSKEVANNLFAEEQRLAEEQRAEEKRTEQEKIKRRQEQEEKPLLIFFENNKECKYTISEILNHATDSAICNLTHQKISALLKRLVDKGLVDKSVENKKAYFALAGQMVLIEQKKLFEQYLSEMENAKSEKEFTDIANSFESLTAIDAAKEKASECKTKATEWKIKEAELEKQRIEKENAARIKKQKNKKIAGIAAAVVGIFIIGFVVLNVLILPNMNYDKAMVAIEKGDYVLAYDYLQKAKGTQDSVALAQNVHAELFESGSIYADYHKSIALQNNGIVIDTNNNSYKSATTQNYIAIAGEFGLRADGTVATLDKEDAKKYNIKNWDNVVKISACDALFDSDSAVAGVKRNGRVCFAVYKNDYAEGKEELLSAALKWENIIDVVIADSGYSIAGLKDDGTVVIAGRSDANVTEWEDIVAISMSDYHLVGLKSDGTVVADEAYAVGPCAVDGWKDIIAISANNEHTVGLKIDGTVVATKFDIDENDAYDAYKGQCEVNGWKDIVAISAGDEHTLGLRADGTVVSTEVDYDYQATKDQVAEWKDIKVYR